MSPDFLRDLFQRRHFCCFFLSCYFIITCFMRFFLIQVSLIMCFPSSASLCSRGVAVYSSPFSYTQSYFSCFPFLLIHSFSFSHLHPFLFYVLWVLLFISFLLFRPKLIFSRFPFLLILLSCGCFLVYSLFFSRVISHRFSFLFVSVSHFILSSFSVLFSTCFHYSLVFVPQFILSSSLVLLPKGFIILLSLSVSQLIPLLSLRFQYMIPLFLCLYLFILPSFSFLLPTGFIILCLPSFPSYLAHVSTLCLCASCMFFTMPVSLHHKII